MKAQHKNKQGIPVIFDETDEFHKDNYTDL